MRVLFGALLIICLTAATVACAQIGAVSSEGSLTYSVEPAPPPFTPPNSQVVLSPFMVLNDGSILYYPASLQQLFRWDGQTVKVFYDGSSKFSSLEFQRQTADGYFFVIGMGQNRKTTLLRFSLDPSQGPPVDALSGTGLEATNVLPGATAKTFAITASDRTVQFIKDGAITHIPQPPPVPPAGVFHGYYNWPIWGVDSTGRVAYWVTRYSVPPQWQKIYFPGAGGFSESEAARQPPPEEMYDNMGAEFWGNDVIYLGVAGIPPPPAQPHQGRVRLVHLKADGTKQILFDNICNTGPATFTTQSRFLAFTDCTQPQTLSVTDGVVGTTLLRSGDAVGGIGLISTMRVQYEGRSPVSNDGSFFFEASGPGANNVGDFLARAHWSH